MHRINLRNGRNWDGVWIKCYQTSRNSVCLTFSQPFTVLNYSLFPDSKLSSGKTTFTIAFRVFLWIFVNIPQYGIAWRYRSKPVFWLPQGWFNPIVTWWLAFPFAPKGSVSVMTWTWACKYVLQIGNEAVKVIICEFLFPLSVSYAFVSQCLMNVFSASVFPSAS